MKIHLRLYVLFGLLMFTFTLNAQERLVQGTVKSADGELLVGVNVIIKGTTTGTVSDVNGAYKLSMPDGSNIITFSFIGFIPEEVIVENQTTIDIVLSPDITQLSEIIVVGYDEKDKRKLTSSVATISKDQIELVPMATIDNILQGAAPGLLIQSGNGQPGAPASVLIRGINSINGSSAPLYILDGIQITSGDFESLNPNDFESVSVLKDASASQIYGSRGAAGVILITSKSGKKGATIFKLNTSFGLSPRPEYNDGLRPLNSTQLIDLQQEIGIGATVGLPEEVLDSLKQINTNWLEVLTRDAKFQTHELSASGGNEHTQFYVSGSYFSQEGTSIRSKLDRYTFRTKVTHTQNNFTIQANMFGGFSKREDSESEGGFGRSNPFYSSIRANAYDHAIDPRTGDFALPLDLSASSTANILERINTNDEIIENLKGLVSLSLKYKVPFIEGLELQTLWGIDHRTEVETDFVDPNSFRGPRSQGGQGQLSRDYSRRTRYTGTSSIHYTRQINKDHEIKASLFHEIVYRDSEGFGLTGYGLDRIQTLAGITEGTEDNGFIPRISGGTSGSSLLSYFTNLEYAFKNKFFINTGLRRDGASRFGKNNRYGIFYSAGAGWLLSEESFMSGISAINLLKLRASYGTVGNQSGISDFGALETFSETTYDGKRGIFSGLSNPDLKWETTQKFNVGLDFILLNGIISGNIDYYNDKTVDLFLPVQLSRTTGFSSQNQNVGSLKNEGIEVSLKTKNFSNGKFRWTTQANFTYGKTVVLKLAGGESFAFSRYLLEEGKDYGRFYMVKRAGVNPANGRYLWYDKQGNLTEEYDLDNAVNHGLSTPPYFGGITNTFKHGNLELSVLFTYGLGHERYNLIRTSLDNPTKISRGSVSTNALRFWRQPGDVTDIPDPKKEATFRTDSGWLEDASYIRLRNIMLAYTLPQQLANTMHLKGLRIYLQGQNILTFTSYTGLDPENSSNTEVADYPSLSTYTAGLNISF